MPAGKLTLLHISDLHFGHGDARTRFDQKTVVQELVRDAKEMKEQLGAPSWVLVTGDIAFSAQPKEYEQARAWLDGLLEVVGAQADALLMVPGNHDVDRKLAATPAAKDAHASLRNNPAGLDDYLAHPDSLEAALWPKLRAYNTVRSTDFTFLLSGHPRRGRLRLDTGPCTWASPLGCRHGAPCRV